MHDISKFKRKLPMTKRPKGSQRDPKESGSFSTNVSFPKGFDPEGNQARK
jgi:hypothetical protein